MRRAGSTLLELLVTLAITAVACAIVGLGIRAAPERTADEAETAIAAARHAAVRERRDVTITVRVGGEPHAVTALTDGGLAADSALGLDRLTGERR